MTTPLGTFFSTDEKAVAQVDLMLLGSTIESLMVEFDQEKFEELLSLVSISPKTRRQYRKVSTKTRSQVSSKTLLNSLEALIASRVANMVPVNVSQETRAMTHG